MLSDNVLLSPEAVAVVFLVISYGFIWYFSPLPLRTRGLRLPPEPTQKWLTGNLHQLPRLEPWLTFASWSKEFGPIVYYRVFGDKTILLNSGKVATDLLESRSSIYSDRPKTWMMGELSGRNSTVFFMQLGNPLFKIYRRLLQNGLNPRAAKSYRPIQMQELQLLLHNLAQSPENFRAHIRRNAIAVILNVTYGYQISSAEDPLIQYVEKAFMLVDSLSIPGKFWVEFFPIIRFLPTWLPGAGFKRKAYDTGRELRRLERIPFDWAKDKIISGDLIESFLSKHIYVEDGKIVETESLDDLKWCSAALYIGGGDTTVSAMLSFFLLMAMNPDVQKQAQREIDAIAPNRLPTVDDYDSLPFLRAVIKEVMRWAPVVPLGLAHKAMKDDVYEGYLIPEGITVIANIWAITHDEDMYPNPFVFDPCRYLGDNPQTDPFKFVFGFGRRVCPGAHLAEMSMFLNMASILAVFDISKAVDENGVEINPKIEWTTGITMHLKPFQCRIQPRSEEQLLLVG